MFEVLATILVVGLGSAVIFSAGFVLGAYGILWIRYGRDTADSILGSLFAKEKDDDEDDAPFLYNPICPDCGFYGVSVSRRGDDLTRVISCTACGYSWTYDPDDQEFYAQEVPLAEEVIPDNVLFTKDEVDYGDLASDE